MNIQIKTLTNSSEQNPTTSLTLVRFFCAQSGDEDVTPTRIDEEGDTFPEGGGVHSHTHGLDSNSDPAILVLPKMTNRTRHHSKMSRPIPIGIHHTVSGHEAMDLAKRLNEELAAQQAKANGSLGSGQTGPLSPKSEPRARSLEQQPEAAGIPGRIF